MGYVAWLGEYGSVLPNTHQCEDGCTLVRKDGGNVCMNYDFDRGKPFGIPVIVNSVGITRNYSDYWDRLFGKHIFDFLHGIRAEASIPLLAWAISQLSDDGLGDKDGWAATDGNVKRCLTQMLTLAEVCPDEVWSISE